MIAPREEPGRLASLDAFRGFAIASMMIVNNPGNWDHVYAPLAHAEWNGWTFTDTVFPFFLFAAGMAMALSFARRAQAGDDRTAILVQTVKRAGVIFLVGIVLNLFPGFDLATVRIPGVLQRIALCIVIAAPLALHLRTTALFGAILALFAAYTLPMLLVPVPDGSGTLAAGVLEPGRDFGAYVDRLFLGGHLWSKSRTWDPEGLVSTLPAACSLLFGVIAARWLRSNRRPRETIAGLAAGAFACVAIGLAVDDVLMPINKNLWTPSYCVFMTGLALALFAVLYWAMDISAVRAPARRTLLPLTIFGMNALFLFALSGFIGRLLVALKLKAPLYAPLAALPVAPEVASLFFAIGFGLFMFAVAWFMWTKRWFVKA